MWGIVGALIIVFIGIPIFFELLQQAWFWLILFGIGAISIIWLYFMGAFAH